MKNEEHLNEQVEKEHPLTEEELFLEEVLRAQEEALQKEREERLNGSVPKKRKPFITRLIIWCMAFGLVFSTFAILFEIYSIPAIEFIKTSAKLSQDEDVKNYKKSVVEISTGKSKGTGFIISNEGYIITNAHVTAGNKDVSVVIPQVGLLKGNVVEEFSEVDLAVVKLESSEQNLPFLPLSDSFTLQKNEKVRFIGNPLYFTNIANEGSVVDIGKFSLSTTVGMLKAPVYKGNSGSPVINKEGKVIGVIYATTKADLYGKVGLFIPIDAFHDRFQLK